MLMNNCTASEDEQRTQYIISLVSSGCSILGAIATIVCFFCFSYSTPFAEEQDFYDSYVRSYSTSTTSSRGNSRPSSIRNYNSINKDSSNEGFRKVVLPSAAHLRESFTKGNRQPTLFKLIIGLAIADLLMASLVFAINIILLISPNAVTNDLCVAGRSLFEVFALSTFVWTCNIAFTVFRMLLKNQDFENRPDSRLGLDIANNFAGWIVPIIFGMVVYFKSENMVKTEFESCRLGGWYSWVFWFAPLCLSVGWNVLFFLLFLWRIRSVFGLFASEYTVLVRIQRRLSLYLLVFVICWIWSVINHLLDISNVCIPFGLRILQDVFHPLQGFLNFIIYTKSQMIRFKSNYDETEQEEGTETNETNPLLNEIDQALLKHIQSNITDYYDKKDEP